MTSALSMVQNTHYPAPRGIEVAEMMSLKSNATIAVADAVRARMLVRVSNVDPLYAWVLKEKAVGALKAYNEAERSLGRPFQQVKVVVVSDAEQLEVLKLSMADCRTRIDRLLFGAKAKLQAAELHVEDSSEHTRLLIEVEGIKNEIVVLKAELESFLPSFKLLTFTVAIANYKNKARLNLVEAGTFAKEAVKVDVLSREALDLLTKARALDEQIVSDLSAQGIQRARDPEIIALFKERLIFRLTKKL